MKKAMFIFKIIIKDNPNKLVNWIILLITSGSRKSKLRKRNSKFLANIGKSQ